MASSPLDSTSLCPTKPNIISTASYWIFVLFCTWGVGLLAGRNACTNNRNIVSPNCRGRACGPGRFSDQPEYARRYFCSVSGREGGPDDSPRLAPPSMTYVYRVCSCYHRCMHYEVGGHVLTYCCRRWKWVARKPPLKIVF
jgi:hypothetical protein